MKSLLSKLKSRRFWILTFVAVLVALVALSAGQASQQIALADDAGNADVTTNGCMQDLAGFGLNCTANDIQIAGVTNLEIIDDGCAYPGDTVEFTADFEVLLTAKERHDIGLYFATDGDPNGDGALTGECTIATPAYAPDPPWLDLDGTNDPLPGDNKPSGIQDTCGDIDADHNPLFPTVTITAVCIDTDGDGQLNLPNCTSWRQPGANDLCTSPLGAFPGSPSKCRCDVGFQVPIEVPAAELQVVKTAGVTSVDEPGEEVTFTVEVTNTGIDPNNNVTLNSLIDDVYGDVTQVQGDVVSTTCAVPQTIAGDGGTYTCTFTAFVSGNAGDIIIDTVTASGTDDNGNPVSGFDDATVTVLDVPPTATLTKTANPTSVNEGDGLVEFSVVVQNTSTAESLTLSALNDDVYGDITQVQGNIQSTTCSVPQTIAPSASYSCSFFAFVVGEPPGPQIDTVTGTVSDDDGNTIYPFDDATVTILDVPPTATLTKTANPTSVNEPGDDVTFTVVVANTSTAESLTLSALNDDVYGDITQVQGDIVSTTCAVPQTLARSGQAGDTYTCSFVAAVDGEGNTSQTDIVTGTVSDNDGNTIYPFDDATVDILDVPPAASLIKTATEVVVTYQVAVTNDSTAEALTLSVLDDDQFGDITQVQGNVLLTTCVVPQTLARSGQAGDTYTCSFDGKVSMSPHVDTVTGTVSDNEGGSVTPSDSATVTFE